MFVARLSNGYDAAGAPALGMAVSNIFPYKVFQGTCCFRSPDLNEECSAGQYLAFRLLSTMAAHACVIAYATATCADGPIPAVVAYCLCSCVPIVADVYHGAASKRIG